MRDRAADRAADRADSAVTAVRAGMTAAGRSVIVDRMDERDAIERDGVVRLRGVVDVAAMRARVRGAIDALPLVELAGALRPGPGTDAALWELGRDEVFTALGPTVEQAIATALGARWSSVDAPSGGLAAPNLPCRGEGARWRVPHAAWHVDEPTMRGQARAWGLLAFVCLDDVVAGGGATVAIAGSHRRLLALADELAPAHGVLTTDAALAALTRDDAWWTALVTESVDGRDVLLARSHDDGLRVVELTGAAGDVVLMDPRCLHTVSANVSDRARLTMRLVFARS